MIPLGLKKPGGIMLMRKGNHSMGKKSLIIKFLKRQSYIVYVLPALAFYLVFLMLPIISSFVLSFFDWDGISEIKKYVGLTNFHYIFTDEKFINTIYNTMICVLVAPFVQTALALIIAVLIANVVRGKTLFRALFYTPVILPLVAASMVWFIIYGPTYGLLNSIIRLFGFRDFSQAWLGDTKTALLSVLVISIWRWTGFNIVIFMAGIQNISPEYYEAGSLDGVTPIQAFRYITIPLLYSSIVLNFALNLIGYLKLFDVIFVTTKGGPAYSTNVISTYVYFQAFQFNEVGTASAASVVLFALIAGFSIIYFRLVKKYEN
jgi:ABC-type sugar transport system permease subunit